MKYVITAISLLLVFSAGAQDRDPQSILRSGNQWYTTGQFEKAATDYRLVPVTDPAHLIAQYDLGVALYKLGQTDEAMQAFSGTAENTHDRSLAAKAWYNKGVALSKLQRTEESIEAYKNALRRDPNDRQARENLQKALLELKKKQNKQPKKQQQPKPQQQQMNRKEAEEKLKLLEQKEKQVQQRMQQEKSKTGSGNTKDW
jgi:Ca-activated chloride channel family protein